MRLPHEPKDIDGARPNLAGCRESHLLFRFILERTTRDIRVIPTLLPDAIDRTMKRKRKQLILNEMRPKPLLEVFSCHNGGIAANLLCSSSCLAALNFNVAIMGHRAFVQHCFGVIVDRDLAKQVHEHLIAQLRSAGCSDEAIYEDGDRGDVSHCVIVELLAHHLDAAWEDASMFGLGAATSSQETQWFGELQCNAEIESYALAFPVDKPLPNSSEIAKLWQSTFGDALDSLGVSLTPAWQTVAQIS